VETVEDAKVIHRPVIHPPHCMNKGKYAWVFRQAKKDKCRLRVVKRLCMYQGAINKAVNCYECRDDLTMENIARYPIHARRSESAFVVSVLAVSMVLFAFVPVMNPFITIGLRMLILLAVAALLNEPYSALESADLTLPVRITRAPMDLMQHITVLEPTEQMLEVAVCAFRAALGENDEEVRPD